MKKLALLLFCFSSFVFSQDEDIPQEILELERSFEETPPMEEIDSAPERVEDLSQGAPVPKVNEPGEDLPPGLMLSRVPLLPPLSSANWRRFAGPQFARIYRVKKGDSLWIISQRLFGNPHLWPKIWQLNANMGNPHTLNVGSELMFTPGNPNASPILAFRKLDRAEDSHLPQLTGHITEYTVADKIRDALMDEESGVNRFRSFLVRYTPEVLARIPKRERVNHKILFQEGDRFRIAGVPPGDYAIVRTEDPKERGVGGKILWWLGNIRVTEPVSDEDRNALILQAYEDINPGDLVVVRTFAMAPLAVHKEFMGRSKRADTRFVNIDSQLITLSGEGYLLGAKFRNDAAGPTLGGVVNIMRSNQRVATAVLIDRDRDLGTFWVVESAQEVLPTDYLE